MSFIRHKIIRGKKYAYEIKSYWDSEKKKPKQHSKYLGPVNDKGNIVKLVSKTKEKII